MNSSTEKQKKRPPLWLIITTFILATVVIGLSLIPSDKKPEIIIPHKEQAAAVPTPVFDVSLLLGKNINQIKRILGPGEMQYQATSIQIGRGDITSTIEYIKDDYSLTIDYYDNTLKVESMMYGPTANNVNDYHDILLAGNLKEDNPHYLIKAMPVLGKPGEFASVKIICQ
jgi:hypothetical protein